MVQSNEAKLVIYDNDISDVGAGRISNESMNKLSIYLF